MRLDFNVLWVDDQAQELRGTEEGFSRRLAAEGFVLHPTYCGTIRQLSERLADSVFTDEVDLILVDWELGSGDRGEGAIETIRERVPYKDIIFYSARTDTSELRRLAFTRGLAGVYFADRNDLVDEAIGVFESLVKKALDLDHIRGIVLGATSDIDQLIRDALGRAHRKADAPQREEIMSLILKRIEEKIPDVTKRVGKLRANLTLEAIMKDHFTFTANDSARILLRVLEFETFADHREYRDTLNKYMTDAVRARNDLGHRTLLPDGKPGLLSTGGDVVKFEDLKSLRRLLIELRTQFRTLNEGLGDLSN